MNILQDSFGKIYILSDQLECAAGLMDFMAGAIYGSGGYFEKTSTWSRQEKISPLGLHLSMLDKYACIFSRDYVFHPLMMFFFEEYRAHEIRHFGGCKGNMHLNSGGRVANVFDDFLTVMRKNAFNCNLKKKVADWGGKIKKNKKRLISLENKLFNRHSRLTVIRLDLDYRVATFKIDEIDSIYFAAEKQKGDDLSWYFGGEDISNPRDCKILVALEEVQRDRQRLFANMKGKPSLFRHLEGYVWRIECSPKAGYHMHVAFFFNGAKIEKHEWLAQEIGRYWEKNITEGRGRFHNCNSAWDKNALTYGLGEINSYDTAKRRNLRDKVLSYLCKSSQAVLVLPHANCHLFGSGFARRDRSKGRGRPRTRVEEGDVKHI